jgi:hypothetical protein
MGVLFSAEAGTLLAKAAARNVPQRVQKGPFDAK